MVVLRTPCDDLRSACHGGVVGCGKQNWLTAIVRVDHPSGIKSTDNKRLLLGEKLAASAA